MTVTSTLQESTIQGFFPRFFPVGAANAITSSLFQAEEKQGCVFFMRMSTRDSVNLHLCPVCARASVHSLALNQH